MCDLIPTIVNGVLQFIKSHFKDAFMFVFQKLKYWYTYMYIASFIVVYYLFKALEEAGILAGFKRTVQNAMGSIFHIAQHCFPLIADLHDMLNCISNV